MIHNGFPQHIWLIGRYTVHEANTDPDNRVEHFVPESFVPPIPTPTLVYTNRRRIGNDSCKSIVLQPFRCIIRVSLTRYGAQNASTLRAVPRNE